MIRKAVLAGLAGFVSFCFDVRGRGSKWRPLVSDYSLYGMQWGGCEINEDRKLSEENPDAELT